MNQDHPTYSSERLSVDTGEKTHKEKNNNNYNNRNGWEKCSTGNCARSLNLTIQTNGICTTQNPT